MGGFTRDGVKESRKVVKSSWRELVRVDQVESHLVISIIIVIMAIRTVIFVFIIVRSIRPLSPHFLTTFTTLSYCQYTFMMKTKKTPIENKSAHFTHHHCKPSFNDMGPINVF